MAKFNRRQFIALTTAGLGTALAANWVFRSQHDLTAISPSIALPKSHKSSGGLLEIDLEARESLVNIGGGGNSAKLITYNGQIPGPRLEVQPGDSVRINFNNNLSQSTNIHYHGLHIPITGNADNVFLKIPPSEGFTYEFKIAKNHPAGLFWYHPHLHGLVAEQLFGGLAGLFVVRGKLDEIPAVKTAVEQFVVLQDFALDNRGNRLPDSQLSIMRGREGNMITVNGEVNPHFTIPTGKLLRLRILNASPSRFYQLSLENHPFYLIATDGGALTKPVKLTELLLTPGERADILIQPSQEPGEYRLLNLPYQRGGGMMGGHFNNEPQILATVSYQTPATPPLPTQLIPVEPLPKAQKTRHFQMNHGMMPGQGMVFLLNGQPYQSQRLDTSVQLNTVEDWELVNTGMMDHPFHVHGNPFQIISRNGQPELYAAWKDVALVKPGETVIIRMAFRDFVGKTVYHCHILDHEDLGMMANLNIQA